MRWFRSGFSRGRRRWLRIIKWGLVGAAAVGLYGVLIPPRCIQVCRCEVILPNLPRDLDGLRVVQISDVHMGPLFRRGSLRRVLRLANSCHPDLVVLTGDFASYGAIGYVPGGAEEFAMMKPRLGVYACLGNHDHWEGAARVRTALQKQGVRVLVNENVEVARGVYLAGIDDLMSGKPDLNRTLKGIPDTGALLILSHNPAILPKLPGRRCLVLSGHTHGGQIALPFLGPRRTIGLPVVRTLARWKEWLGVRMRGGDTNAVDTYRHPAGWYQDGKAKMYVSRGVGTNQGMPIRLNCPPEMVCFTLRSE